MNSYYPIPTSHLVRQGVLVLVLLLVTSIGRADSYADSDADEGPSASQAIVVLGDSISAGYGIQREQGWVSLLQDSLLQHESAWVAVNASVSGETTSGGRARLAGVLGEHDPGIVIIELGGNDGLRGYPIAKIRANLTAMVDMVQRAGAIPMLVAMRIPPNYGVRYTQAFDNVFNEVAEETGSLFVPFLLEEVALADNMMQSDGIHPTAEAQPLLLDVVWQQLQPLL